jgi:uncharacterized protein (UPF0548 family)
VTPVDGPALTYPEVGGSLRPDLPPGYRHLEQSRVVGRGRDAFERAARDLLSWEVQRRAGIRVVTQDPTVATGTEARLRIGFGPLAVTAPCRVVRVVDEERRQGFAYGTLPGHPERGEELFLLTLEADDSVTFTVRAFSRPATRLARLGGPLTPLLQDLATRRYLRALLTG